MCSVYATLHKNYSNLTYHYNHGPVMNATQHNPPCKKEMCMMCQISILTIYVITMVEFRSQRFWDISGFGIKVNLIGDPIKMTF